MYSGIELASFELLIFLGISVFIRNKNYELQYLDFIAYLWFSFTVLTGIWEYYFIKNYQSVSLMALELIKRQEHVWNNSYTIDYLYPDNFSQIFYSEYGAYADREYMLNKNLWSRVIESSHCLLCGIFSFLAIYYRSNSDYPKFYITSSVAMGSQLMNSVLYMVNYYYQCEDETNVNYNSTSFPAGELYIKRPFMYINLLWTLMPLYTIWYLMTEMDFIDNKINNFRNF